MSYFHLNSHIRCCVYQDEVIILDLIADRYIFLDKQDSETFLHILERPFIKDEHGRYSLAEKNLNFDEMSMNNAILDLRKAGILSSADFSIKLPDVIHQANEGMGNIDWNLTTQLSEKNKATYFVGAYFSLIKVFVDMRLQGLNHLVQKIKAHKKIVNAEATNINNLVASLNKACFYFPVRVKCLEWSLALYSLARRHGVNCQFVVGLQNYPFKSHAWIEHENRIIADAPDLNKALAIIIREPA